MRILWSVKLRIEKTAKACLSINLIRVYAQRRRNKFPEMTPTFSHVNHQGVLSHSNIFTRVLSRKIRRTEHHPLGPLINRTQLRCPRVSVKIPCKIWRYRLISSLTYVTVRVILSVWFAELCLLIPNRTTKSGRSVYSAAYRHFRVRRQYEYIISVWYHERLFAVSYSRGTVRAHYAGYTSPSAAMCACDRYRASSRRRRQRF